MQGIRPAPARCPVHGTCQPCSSGRPAAGVPGKPLAGGNQRRHTVCYAAADAMSLGMASPDFGRPAVAAPPVQADEASFDELLLAGRPVLADFCAKWCGPCKLTEPTMLDVARTWKNTLQVVKIDTEASPGLAKRYGVQALPTLILFKDGQPIDRVVGLMPKQRLFERLRYFIKSWEV